MNESPETHDSTDTTGATETSDMSGGRRRAGGKPALALLRDRRHRRLLIAAAGAVVIALVATVLLRTVFAIPVLDSTSLTKGVHDVLTEDFHLTGVSAVVCPEKQRIETGNTFTCQVKVNGQPRTVPVEITNDAGEYRVNQPR